MNQEENLFKDTVDEQEFMDCLSNKDLFEFISSFHSERRKYLKQLINYLDQQLDQLDQGVNLDFSRIKKERNIYWEKIEHYEELTDLLSENIGKSKLNEKDSLPG